MSFINQLQNIWKTEFLIKNEFLVNFLKYFFDKNISRQLYNVSFFSSWYENVENIAKKVTSLCRV